MALQGINLMHNALITNTAAVKVDAVAFLEGAKHFFKVRARLQIRLCLDEIFGLVLNFANRRIRRAFHT